jgi:FKBP-type peptidyl-prolyl cis-trans isomerase
MNIKPGIKLLEEVEGVGERIKIGDSVEIKLNGWLSEGEQIQKDHIEILKLGARKIIPGIEYAIEGMKINGKRKVKLSPHLGYKEKGVKGLIPPNALLIYEIEVLSVQSNT